MTDPFPASLYAVYSNPLPDQEAELHAWYEDVHIPDSFDAGLFHSVRRYQSVGENRARFLTLWGGDFVDTADALGAVRPAAEALRKKGRVQSFQEIVFQENIFRQEVRKPRPGTESRWLSTLHSRWSRAEAVVPYDEWLGRTESADFLHAGDAVARYGLTHERARSLVLLEGSTRPDLGRMASVDGIRPGLPPFGPPVPIFEGGSPAPSAPEAPEPPDDARSPAVVWLADWELIGMRQR